MLKLLDFYMYDELLQIHQKSFSLIHIIKKWLSFTALLFSLGKWR